MIALWMVYAAVVSAAFAAAATILDRAAGPATRRRRWIWMAALVLSAAVPASSALGPRLGVTSGRPAVERAERGATGMARGTVSKSASVVADLIARAERRSLGSASSALWMLWLATTTLAIGAHGVASWSLARRRDTWRRGEIDGEPVLVAPASGPAVIGALRPAIVVPEWSLDLSREQRALLLEHERQHVAARDPLLLQCAALIAALMPWNVPAWWLIRRLRLAVELDCDARVLAGGHDARAYGNLLLDVCARRLARGPLLSPALFERSSSLTRRILAMYPDRRPFARARVALGLTTALAIAAFACDMPSPEVVAPDGTNQATKRLYGELVTLEGKHSEDTRALVTRYFPTVAKGEGPAILFLVKTDRGNVVGTDVQLAAETEEMRRNTVEGPTTGGTVLLREKRLTAELRINKVVRRQPDSLALVRPRAGVAWKIPSGIGALQPNDIATVDISKHAPGTVAPKAVSLVTITLKPGAKVPTSVER